MNTLAPPNRIRIDALVGGAFLALLLLLVFVDPERQAFYPRCPLLLLTGLHCPGCGSQRALHALVHGHLGAALRLNPLAVLVLPFLVYSTAGWVRAGVTGRGLPQPRIRTAWIWGFLVVVLVFTVIRNLPGSGLAPGA
jgi:hypothetical protein